MSRRGAPQLRAWTQSLEWRAIASRQAKANLRALSLRPKCGAHCRTSGQPCRNPVVDGRTRCAKHGGATPKGDGKWHRPRWPDRSSPTAITKLNRKLHDLQRAADKRQKRIAGMTPEELAIYRKWQREREPTSASDRTRKREQRRQDREARISIQRVLNDEPQQKSPEAIEIEERLAALKAELAHRQPAKGDVFE